MRAQAVILGIFVALGFINAASAETLDLRVFGQVSPVHADDLNAYNTSQNLPEIKSITALGLEGNWRLPFLPNLSLGVRFTTGYKKSSDTQNTNSQNPYYVSLQTHSMGIVARYDILQAGPFRADIFGLIGLQGTRVDFHTASHEGTLDQSFDHGLVSGINAYGASVAVGFANIYVFTEGGIQNYNVNELKLSPKGTAPASVHDLDMSGTYFLFGIMLTGIPRLGGDKGAAAKK